MIGLSPKPFAAGILMCLVASVAHGDQTTSVKAAKDFCRQIDRLGGRGTCRVYADRRIVVMSGDSNDADNRRLCPDFVKMNRTPGLPFDRGWYLLMTNTDYDVDKVASCRF